MANIVTRSGKGSELTFAEVDSNFTGLANDTATLLSRVYTPIANVAAIPASPADGDRIEISDSTGIRSVSSIRAVPNNFPSSGDVSTLQVRLQYSSSFSKWLWLSYESKEPDRRYAPLASPALTDTPTAPTAAPGTSTTQIATTAFVANGYGTIASVTAASVAATSAQSGMRNRLINGDMRIDQRQGYPLINSTYQSCVLDRWKCSVLGSGSFRAGSQTIAPAGFARSLGLQVETTDTSPASNSAYFISQYIEGTNFVDFGFGSAAAKTLTLSFWVRSSVIGNYHVTLKNSSPGGQARSYTALYQLTAANAWEYKTVTIPGDTSGAWNSTLTSSSAEVYFDLGCGSLYKGNANTWNSYNVSGTTAQVNWIGNSGATFYVTGVQLEAGVAPTAYEFRHYGTELALCQRYYQSGTGYLGGFAGGAGNCRAGFVPCMTTMRAAPSVSITPRGTPGNVGGQVAEAITPNGFGVYVYAPAGGTFALDIDWTATAEL